MAAQSRFDNFKKVVKSGFALGQTHFHDRIAKDVVQK